MGGWGESEFVPRSLNFLNSTRFCCLLSLGTLCPLVSQDTMSPVCSWDPGTLLPRVPSCSNVPWCGLVLAVP